MAIIYLVTSIACHGGRFFLLGLRIVIYDLCMWVLHIKHFTRKGHRSVAYVTYLYMRRATNGPYPLSLTDCFFARHIAINGSTSSVLAIPPFIRW